MKQVANYAGFALLLLLVVVVGPFVTWVSFWAYGSPLDELIRAIATAAANRFMVLFSLALVCLALLLALSMKPARRLYVAAAVLFSVLLPLLGACLGHYLLVRQKDRNIAYAREAAAALEEYCQEHGTYPERLEEIQRPLKTVLELGNQACPLEYQRTGEGGFVLQFRHGGYTYRYVPRQVRWDRHAD